MKRLFGGKTEKPVAPTLSEATDTANKRGGVLDEKIRALDKQLLDFKNQLKSTRPGPAQNRIKQRALQILKQKRMYEGQRDQLSGVVWNMEQAAFASENVQTAIHVVDAMKASTGALKEQMQKVQIDDIEDTMDDMADLLEDTNEINEALSRNYALEEDIDEAELDDELAAIDEQLQLEAELGESETPAYLQDEEPAPAEVTEPAAVPVAAGGEQVDEFGLPVHA
mmetsp:Transcript_24193/g.48943  ORF Transcript_24193/g.48943 Transcript_24193/m.48943 type:complete len:225 (+) Transcript_24193:144-818(+)|eukprot:CAMPEP_0181309074 /NCGR_PEP_ID=MMETSP1101-20121128/11820_1 /TAXON_ID=46948 /ORGANISM="Rhodomonas abbreviata, Strain Caron Lab Isolate" /LENGTH=224 /DNA_ID=CAMNT_0023415535 /DNA_START=212 /DNA_END=886 /DNA_ORIENTATION=+